MIKSTFACTVAAAALLSFSSAQAVVIADFEGGIGPVVNHPDPGAFDTWYDITSDAFATPSAGTLSATREVSPLDAELNEVVRQLRSDPDTPNAALMRAYGQRLCDRIEDKVARLGTHLAPQLLARLSALCSELDSLAGRMRPTH